MVEEQVQANIPIHSTAREVLSMNASYEETIHWQDNLQQPEQLEFATAITLPDYATATNIPCLNTKAFVENSATVDHHLAGQESTEPAAEWIQSIASQDAESMQTRAVIQVEAHSAYNSVRKEAFEDNLAVVNDVHTAEQACLKSKECTEEKVDINSILIAGKVEQESSFYTSRAQATAFETFSANASKEVEVEYQQDLVRSDASVSANKSVKSKIEEGEQASLQTKLVVRQKLI
uniref:Uncharacterized protein n=1 Tax=Ditylenchus dipsaci TaxID=166011 RepID=A0A915EN05_9BILA